MFLNDNVRDSGLSWLTSNGTRLHVCSQEPTTYAQAASTYQLGFGNVVISVPEDRPGGGRRVSVSAIVAAPATATGTATHFAITNGSNTLCAAGPLAASLGLTATENFSTTVLYVNTPDEVSVA